MKLIQWFEVLLCFAPCPFTLATSTMFILTCFCSLSLSPFQFPIAFCLPVPFSLCLFTSSNFSLVPCHLSMFHVPCPPSLASPYTLCLVSSPVSAAHCPLLPALVLCSFFYFPFPLVLFLHFLGFFPFSHVLVLVTPFPFVSCPQSLSHYPFPNSSVTLALVSFLVPYKFGGNHPPTAGGNFKVKTRC